MRWNRLKSLWYWLRAWRRLPPSETTAIVRFVETNRFQPQEVLKLQTQLALTPEQGGLTLNPAALSSLQLTAQIMEQLVASNAGPETAGERSLTLIEQPVGGDMTVVEFEGPIGKSRGGISVHATCMVLKRGIERRIIVSRTNVAFQDRAKFDRLCAATVAEPHVYDGHVKLTPTFRRGRIVNGQPTEGDLP